jgi:hypothetical protein
VFVHIGDEQYMQPVAPPVSGHVVAPVGQGPPSGITPQGLQHCGTQYWFAAQVSAVLHANGPASLPTSGGASPGVAGASAARSAPGSAPVIASEAVPDPPFPQPNATNTNAKVILIEGTRS